MLADDLTDYMPDYTPVFTHYIVKAHFRPKHSTWHSIYIIYDNLEDAIGTAKRFGSDRVACVVYVIGVFLRKRLYIKLGKVMRRTKSEFDMPMQEIFDDLNLARVVYKKRTLWECQVVPTNCLA